MNDHDKELYSDIKGTGPISSIIFSIVTVVLMWFVSNLVH